MTRPSGEHYPSDATLFELQPGDTADNRLKQFEMRLRQFAAYAERERGAWGLFTRVAMATMAEGRRPFYGDNGSQLMVHFPPINYEPDPGDSTTRRQIVLKAERLTRGKALSTVTPWLEVYTMADLKQYGIDPDHADPAFVRGDLEAMAGHRDWGNSAELFETMLNQTSPARVQQFEQKLAEQSQYIDWLQRAAWATDTPLTYQEPFTPDTTLLFGTSAAQS